MKNRVQKVYLNLEFNETTNKYRFVGSNLKNGEQGNAYFTLVTDVKKNSEDSHLDDFTNQRQKRTALKNCNNNGLVDLVYAKNVMIEDYVKPETLLDLKEKGWENIWSDQAIMKLAHSTGYKVECYGHIARQEFAVGIKRFKTGKQAECLKSYEDCLKNYADSKVFTQLFTKKFLRRGCAVAGKLLKVDLLKDKLINPETGLFNFSLVHALPADAQVAIAKALDVIAFGAEQNKYRSLLKKPNNDKNAPHLVTSTGSYIVAFDILCETETQVENTPDISVEHDSNNPALVAFNKGRKQTAKAVVAKLDALAEETSEEETADAVLLGTEE